MVTDPSIVTVYLIDGDYAYRQLDATNFWVDEDLQLHVTDDKIEVAIFAKGSWSYVTRGKST